MQPENNIRWFQLRSSGGKHLGIANAVEQENDTWKCTVLYSDPPFVRVGLPCVVESGVVDPDSWMFDRGFVEVDESERWTNEHL